MSDFKVETKCLHSGYTPSKGEPCALPIYQSTTYKYDTTDEMGQLFDLKAEGYFYTRLQNPTNDAVAAKIADLEGIEVSFCLKIEELSHFISSIIFISGTLINRECAWFTLRRSVTGMETFSLDFKVTHEFSSFLM